MAPQLDAVDWTVSSVRPSNPGPAAFAYASRVSFIAAVKGSGTQHHMHTPDPFGKKNVLGAICIRSGRHPTRSQKAVSEVNDVKAVSMLASDPLAVGQPLTFVDHESFDVAVTDSHVAVGQMVSVRGKVNEILFQIELHNLLPRLKKASPESDKPIVKEAFTSKTKKTDATGKACAAA
ncbi:Gibberellin 2-beta-dioxygenase 8 [Hordeum vulgare]|nr:Gibberellin 2-beta-dioxygenase 8 [Hordeum vulgare]